MASNSKNLAELLNGDVTVTATDIADGSVTTAKLADDAVTTAKIPDDAVTTAKIPDDAVTTAKIPDDAITATKIGSGAVEGAMTTQIGGRRNIIINGAMQVAQRGTSLTVSSAGNYSLDRFYVQSNVGSGHTWAQVQETPSGEGFNYSAKLTVGTGATPVTDNFGRVIYYIEGYDSQALNWGNTSPKAVTFSFWVKSSVTGSFGGCFKLQKESPYPGFYYTYTINSANTWEYKTVTVPSGVFVDGNMDSTNGIGVLVAFDLGEGPSRSATTGYNSSNNGGTLGVTGADKILATSGATWQITGVQLEVGTVATPFEHRSYGEELALCQRYYYQIGTGEAQYTPVGVGNTEATFSNLVTFYPVKMRAIPSLTYTGLQVFDASVNTGVTSTRSFYGGLQTANMQLFHNSALTRGRGVYCNLTGSSSYAAFDAEL